MCKKWLLWFCFLSFFVLVQAQVPTTFDSLTHYLQTEKKDSNYVTALNEFAFLLFKQGKYDEATKCVDQMNVLTQKLHYGKGYYRVENMRGVIAYGRQQYPEALNFFFKSLEAHKKYSTPKADYQNSLNNICIIYNALGDREKATKYAMELIDYQEKYRLEPLKTTPYDQIGNNLKFYKKYDEALAYYNKSVAISTRDKNFIDVAIGENHIGNVYDDMGKIEQAIVHYQRGLKIAEKEGYKQLQVDFLTNLGRMYEQVNDFEKAEKYLRKSETICIELKSDGSLRIVYQNMGKLYFSQKKYVQAEQYYLKAFGLSKTIEDPEDRYALAQDLAELYEQTGNYKSAYQYKKEAEIAKDSIFKVETAQTVEDLLKKYETTQKEQQIALLNEKNGRSAFQNKALLIGLGLLAVALTFVFRNLQTKRRAEKIITGKNNILEKLNIDLEEANRTKAKLFGIIGHDLRGPIKQVYQFLKLQQLNPQAHTEQEKRERSGKIEVATESLLETMEDLLLWSKTQMSALTPNLKPVVLLPALQPVEQLVQLSIDAKNIQFKNRITAEITVMADYNFLQTIYRNLLQNAIKASPQGGAVVVDAHAENRRTTLTVQNDGPAFTHADFEKQIMQANTTQTLNGLGLQLVQDLCSKMNATVLFKPKAGNGTIAEIVFAIV